MNKFNQNKKIQFFLNPDIRIRVISSILGNIARGGINLLSGILVARSLGPSEYGNYNFLLYSFVAINRLIDMGTSSAFFTFISKQKRGIKFYLYYILWMLIQFVFIIFFIFILMPENWIKKIWLGHEMKIILLAFIASFSMNQIWNMVASIGESLRATIGVQLRNVGISVAFICCLLVLIYMNMISVINLFILNIVLYLTFSAIFLSYIKDMIVDIKEETFQNIFKEFKEYCTPLIVSVWVSHLYLLADTWFLQNFGGSTEQGYYSIAEKFSAVSLIATTSILKVFWKEISFSSLYHDIIRIKGLYFKTVRRLFFLSAFISCFLIPYSKEILFTFLGKNYVSAWLAFSLMLILPIFQTIGQINGTFFYATSNTKTLRDIIVFMSIISIPLSYFLLANSSAPIPGLDLGATGLALKMIILTVININIRTYMITKLYKWQFTYIYQIIDPVLLIGCSYLIKKFLNLFFAYLGFKLSLIPLIFISFLLYLIIIIILILKFPNLFSLKKDDLVYLFKYLIEKVFYKNIKPKA